MTVRFVTLLVVAALAAGGGYYYWQHRSEGKLDIQTVAAKRADVRRAVSTSGAVSALVTVDIGSQLSGNVSEVNVDYSSEVKKDQVLARIEPSTFESKVRQSEASVAVAKANVTLQEAAVERAEANLHKAELDLHRAQELVAKGAGAQVTLDTA
ncbi:MAG: biotin/lipoyl-binding protein, partial [Methyloceanibacter sp.]